MQKAVISPLALMPIALLALSGPCLAQASEAGSDIGKTEIDAIIRKEGYVGALETSESSPLSAALRDFLIARARDGGAEAMERALSEAGASCNVVRVTRRCELRRFRILRSVDLFFPKYGRTDWIISISYDRYAAVVRNTRVTYRTSYALIEQ